MTFHVNFFYNKLLYTASTKGYLSLVKYLISLKRFDLTHKFILKLEFNEILIFYFPE